MGSIADKLSKLIETKSAIKSAITAKGVTVSDSDPFSSYAGKIAQIESGGGGGEGAVGLVDGTITSYSGNEGAVREYAFRGCKNLRSVNLPNATEIGTYAFYGCDRLIHYESPMVTKIETGAFQLSGVVEIDMPNAIDIGSYGFENCVDLLSINFPNVTTIGTYAFRFCENLVSAVFPALIEVKDYAFTSCKSLVSVDLHSATKLNNSFSLCESLKTLILRTNNLCALAGSNSFYGSPIESGTGYIYVPARLQTSYMYATNWSKYANRIRAIEDYPEICGGTT